MMKISVVFIFIALFLPVTLLAQQKVVTGIVKDVTGILPGVTVREKGVPNNGVAVDGSGKFRITLRGTSNVLIFQFVGYDTREIKVSGNDPIEVILQPSTQGLEEVVVVGLGTRKRVTNTGSVSSISGGTIRNIPTSSVQNTLAGRLPGFFSQQRSGQPGQDASDFFIRGVSSLNAEGNRPLIIVDDIEYTYAQLSQINVNEIENISILKDASTTAIYGVKGANGVLIVTTRRGAMGPPKVNLRIETGLQSPSRTPKFLDAYQTALLNNEAVSNDGAGATLPSFTREDLEHFRTGDDPYGHPDVNWYKSIFKPYSLQANTNLDISGGTSGVKYFISGGALTQNGALRDFSDELSGVNSNYFFRRYNFRTNLDVQATKTLALRLDVTGRFGETNRPYASNVTGEIYDFRLSNPYSAPFLNSDGSYAFTRGTTTQQPTLNARLAARGYERLRTTDFNVLFGATQRLDFITQGLTFKGRIAYASTSQIVRSVYRTGGPPSYYYNSETGTYQLDPSGKHALAPLIVGGDNPIYNTKVNFQAYLDYDRLFGKHHFSSLLLLNQTHETFRQPTLFFSGILAPPIKFRGYSFRGGYDYASKYLIDVNIGYNGSDRFQEPYGFFPALSAGWNVAQEKFFKKAFPFIEIFKLRGSIGTVGSDVTSGNRYLYKSLYYNGPNYYFDHSVASPSIYEGDVVSGNGNVTWEKELKRDIGLDINMFNDRVSITVDYFNNRRYDQLIVRQSLSGIIGVGTTPINLGVVTNRGWDGQISYRPNIGAVQLNISGVFSYAKNKREFLDEPSPLYPNLRQTGTPIGQPFGYTWIGYYQNEEDIAKSAKPFDNIQPGDLKYKDIAGRVDENGNPMFDENGNPMPDGKIDARDIGPIGRPNLPTTTYGLTLGANYKGFSISLLFQGSQGYSFAIQNTGIDPFVSQMQPIHLERWTPENAQRARFPRLTTISGGVNSGTIFPSDFYLIDAKFLRLKTVELGYQVPNKLLPFKINNARLYLSAYNLLTWTNYDLYQQDPEVASNTAGDAYLNQRVVNLGVQVGF
ncbi:TonB-dependent receptor [Mucilaginibacter hurinus]|uniref:TonB-dependent receptor n=1 Tax=Mucilaginibacter hurinus TaxID=2201324 RepID=A0A367GRL3_9SPHI|nr:TonB-dependent receptor [Mucilaginibacter hurinus]RCH55351.1 TonB-dependent receptor [Mucilaginibacter hurinus]